MNHTSETKLVIEQKRPRRRLEEEKLREELNVPKSKDIPISILPKTILEGKKKLITKLYGSKKNYDYLVRMSHKNKWS